MKNFILGFIVALLVAFGGLYLYVKKGYLSFDADQKAERLAAFTGLDAAAIGAARAEVTPRRLNEERAAITLMEVCRRILLRMHSDHQRPLA